VVISEGRADGFVDLESAAWGKKEKFGGSERIFLA